MDRRGRCFAGAGVAAVSAAGGGEHQDGRTSVGAVRPSVGQLVRVDCSLVTLGPPTPGGGPRRADETGRQTGSVRAANVIFQISLFASRAAAARSSLSAD
jgi:hypothetical protein